MHIMWWLILQNIYKILYIQKYILLLQGILYFQLDKHVSNLLIKHIFLNQRRVSWSRIIVFHAQNTPIIWLERVKKWNSVHVHCLLHIPSKVRHTCNCRITPYLPVTSHENNLFLLRPRKYWSFLWDIKSSNFN